MSPMSTGPDEEPEYTKIERDYEGGFTYLNRVLAESASHGTTVEMINIPQLHVVYKYESGHKTFREGLQVLRGDIHRDMQYDRMNNGNISGGYDLNHSIDGYGLEFALKNLGIS